jgi:hypothetical protein
VLCTVPLLSHAPTRATLPCPPSGCSTKLPLTTVSLVDHQLSEVERRLHLAIPHPAYSPGRLGFPKGMLKALSAAPSVTPICRRDTYGTTPNNVHSTHELLSRSLGLRRLATVAYVQRFAIQSLARQRVETKRRENLAKCTGLRARCGNQLPVYVSSFGRFVQEPGVH